MLDFRSRYRRRKPKLVETRVRAGCGELILENKRTTPYTIYCKSLECTKCAVCGCQPYKRGQSGFHLIKVLSCAPKRKTDSVNAGVSLCTYVSKNIECGSHRLRFSICTVHCQSLSARTVIGVCKLWLRPRRLSSRPSRAQPQSDEKPEDANPTLTPAT